MAKNKTEQSNASVECFLNKITDDQRRSDAFKIAAIMQQETGFDPRMWGTAIVGFGSYHYKYETGREGDAPLAGFSPRAKEFSLYLAQTFEQKQKLLQKLGKHKAAVSCVYIKTLNNIDEDVLREMIRNSVLQIKQVYG